MIQFIFSIRLAALAQRTANYLLRALALLLMCPPGRSGTTTSGAGRAASLARRASQRRNNTWRQLSGLSDATLRDIGMTRPALGQYLVDPPPGRPVSGKAPTSKLASARAGCLPRPVRVGT